MSRYAEKTKVPVERSRQEIETTLKRYGADQFGYANDEARAMSSITFRFSDRVVRFVMTAPNRSQYRYKTGWEQACRQRWRALLICVKAKLEAVESGISTFEQEFLAHIVLPDGNTVGDLMAPQIEHAYQTSEQPTGIAGLLPSPNGDSDA